MIPKLKLEIYGIVTTLTEYGITLKHPNGDKSEIKDISFKDNKVPFMLKDVLKVTLTLVEKPKKNIFNSEKIILYRQVEKAGDGYLTFHEEPKSPLKYFITKRIGIIETPFLENNPFYYLDWIKIELRKKQS